MKHPVSINGELPQSLARDVSNLRYDALWDFLHCLSNEIYLASEADKARGRVKLATALREASAGIYHAMDKVGDALVISRPFMDGEGFSPLLTALETIVLVKKADGWRHVRIAKYVGKKMKIHLNTHSVDNAYLRARKKLLCYNLAI